MSLTERKNRGGYLGSTTRKLGSAKVNFAKKKEDSALAQLSNLPLFTSIDNFYLTDFVCENSAIMAKVSKTSRANKRLKRTSIYN